MMNDIENQLADEELRKFHTELLERVPELQKAKIEFKRHPLSGDPAFVICSPTDDQDRDMIIFMCGGLSLSFGPWHTHESLGRDALSRNLSDSGIVDSYDYSILEYIKMIVSGQIVYTLEHQQILELNCKDALLEILTDPLYPNALNMIAWNGIHDRRVSLEELDCPK